MDQLTIKLWRSTKKPRAFWWSIEGIPLDDPSVLLREEETIEDRMKILKNNGHKQEQASPMKNKRR